MKMIVACILAGGLLLVAGPARAQDQGPIDGPRVRLTWQPDQRNGKPIISGYVDTELGMSNYCNMRLLVQTLDAQGQVIQHHTGFIPGTVGAFDHVYFEAPVYPPGLAYKVTITSWDKCCNGQ